MRSCPRKRRHFLTLGTAALAVPALPSVTSATAALSPPLPPRARAAFFSGLMAAYRLTADRRYLDYTHNWAERHAYGIREGVTTRHADNHNASRPTSICTRSSPRRTS